ncbi:hypothetical protein B0H34DRAFT_717890 [Crassisporium funariophilum]|nr:hypothetical protein B0H34DRAFT_717890 [Crassisporium funariophilum]
MEFAGHPMDQDPLDANIPSYTSFAASEPSTDHVKWQGSQTACQALNQLIQSSGRELPEDGALSGTSRGWQRRSCSYEQIPNFPTASTSTSTYNTSSYASSNNSRASSSKYPPSSRLPPHSRSRHAETRARTPELTNLDLSIPLLNKTNPMQFLDIMKGVSARLDENAGVRPSGSRVARTKRRVRGVSLGGASTVQSLGGGRIKGGIVKKGRVDELRVSDALTWDATSDEDRGKGRADAEERNALEVLQGHTSLPDIPPRLATGNSSPQPGDDSFMDVDIEVSLKEQWTKPSFMRTRSQAEMPPPPLPLPAPNTNTLVDRPLPLPQHHSHHPQQKPPITLTEYHESQPIPTRRPLATSASVANQQNKARKPAPIPRLHPLLQHKPAGRASASSSVSIPQHQPLPQIQPQTQYRNQPQPQPQPNPHPPFIPKPASTTVALPPSSTPLFSSTPSSRPPALGMRRTHTFPSRTTTASNQDSSSTVNLPNRQKGFKPPLLSASQPQPQSRSQQQLGMAPSQSHDEQQKVKALYGAGGQESKPARSPPGGSSGSATSSGMNSSRGSSSASSASRQKDSDTHELDSSGSQSPRCLPEPLDGDADSSFGDMSFDMDALEETMRKYD